MKFPREIQTVGAQNAYTLHKKKNLSNLIIINGCQLKNHTLCERLMFKNFKYIM